MNSGERAELLMKLYLVSMRDKGRTLQDVRIERVGFAGTEYRSIPAQISQDFDRLSDEELSQISRQLGIKKAGHKEKSDVYINGSGYSLKSFLAAAPALVNHTARPGFEKACQYAGVDILELDRLVDEYWRLRLSGAISEDIKNSDPRSPFRDAKHILKPVLEYFLFTGSGRGPSDYPADYMLDYVNPADPYTWQILSPNQAVDDIWERLVFSIRAKKGMPTNYNLETYRKANAESIARWVEYIGGDYRGALHVRAHR